MMRVSLTPAPSAVGRPRTTCASSRACEFVGTVFTGVCSHGRVGPIHGGTRAQSKGHPAARGIPARWRALRYHARMITLIEPGSQDLGGFLVRRALPHRRCRHVGPFVFFDHMGPARFEAGRGVDVRPHPHIGLATVTYLFAGALEHRDSLGSVQTIRPGDINWMTAGRGIVHSERTPHAERSAGHDVHGIQIWVALPRAEDATEPSFHHHPARTLPEIECGDVHLRLLVGSAFDRRSPVATHSAMFYVAADSAAGGVPRGSAGTCTEGNPCHGAGPGGVVRRCAA